VHPPLLLTKIKCGSVQLEKFYFLKIDNMDNKDFEDQMDKDFERSLEKIYYLKLLNDPDFKKQLRKEYESVKAIDIQLSRQKFIEGHLTPDELKILNELDLTPKSGYYFQNEAEQKRDALAKEFDEIEQIPEKFRVKNIKQTPTYEALYAINRFINEYTDLSLRDVDTIVIADKYFTLLKNKLETFSPSVQIKLIDEIMLPEVNIAVWTHKKFHPDENVCEYQRRWEQLKNSLNANLITYKDELLKAAEVDNSHLIVLSNENIDRLSEYFTAQFKGIGRNENLFVNNLIPCLSKNRNSGKDYSAIALVIYESTYFKHNKGEDKISFSKWIDAFYNIMGLTEAKCKKKSVVRSIAEGYK
jgi:hypothetical protein